MADGIIRHWLSRYGAACLACMAPAGCDRPDGAGPPPPPAAVEPAGVEAALSAAEEYFSSRDLDSAEAILVELLRRAPHDHRAHELMAGVLYVRGLDARSDGDGEAADALVVRAYEHYRDAAAGAEDLEPRAAAGLHQSAGEIAGAAGLTEAALVEFRAAAALEPDSTKHALYEAQCLIGLERYDEAATVLERVVALDPDEAFAHASLASVALARGDQEAALRHVTEARRIDPASLALRVQEAKVRRRCDQPQRALELLAGVDEAGRAQEAVAYEIAASWLLLGRPGKAAQAWEHAYRADPLGSGAWRAAVGAAEAHLEAGRREEAVLWYRRALRTAPADAPRVEALGRALESDQPPPPAPSS